MAGVQDSALAIAVSKADALGSLPCAMLSPEAMREQLSLLAAHGRAFNVNFFCHAPPRPDAGREAAWRVALAPYFAELDLDQNDIPSGPGRRPFSHDAADVLEEFRPPIVSFHFGLPTADLLERVRGWGAKVISSADDCRRSTLARVPWRGRHHRAGARSRWASGKLPLRQSRESGGDVRVATAGRARGARSHHRRRRNC